MTEYALWLVQDYAIANMWLKRFEDIKMLRLGVFSEYAENGSRT